MTSEFDQIEAMLKANGIDYLVVKDSRRSGLRLILPDPELRFDEDGSLMRTP